MIIPTIMKYFVVIVEFAKSNFRIFIKSNSLRIRTKNNILYAEKMLI